MKLYLTDEEVERLINMIKQALCQYRIKLEEFDKGELIFKDKDENDFKMAYKFSPESKVIHFMECKYQYALFRININSNFHKNADGTRIYGNRINVFSEEEFSKKKDGHTYWKAIALPFKNIRNTDDFLELIEDVIKYANIDTRNKKITFSIQEDLL